MGLSVISRQIPPATRFDYRTPSETGLADFLLVNDTYLRVVKSEQRGFGGVCMCVRRLFTLKRKADRRRWWQERKRGFCRGNTLPLLLDKIAHFEMWMI